MPAGRPPKPAKVLELSGAYKKNPGRRRARAGELANTTGIGEPPREWLEKADHSQSYKDLVRIWHELVSQDYLKVLNGSHRMMLKEACHLVYKRERAFGGSGKMTSGDSAILHRYLTSMGMTPESSARVAEAVRVPDRPGPSSSSSRAGAWGEFSA